MELILRSYNWQLRPLIFLVPEVKMAMTENSSTREAGNKLGIFILCHLASLTEVLCSPVLSSRVKRWSYLIRTRIILFWDLKLLSFCQIPFLLTPHSLLFSHRFCRLHIFSWALIVDLCCKFVVLCSNILHTVDITYLTKCYRLCYSVIKCLMYSFILLMSRCKTNNY